MDKIITQERLKELFEYGAESGYLIRKESRGNGVVAGSILGSRNGQGYLDGMVDGQTHRVHRLIWLYFYGVLPVSQVDHINGIRDDNRIENLRLVTHTQNQWNRRPQAGSTIGLKGVSYRKDRNRWVASILVNGKNQYLGYFKTPEEAHAAYCAAAVKLHGEFARTG